MKDKDLRAIRFHAKKNIHFLVREDFWGAETCGTAADNRRMMGKIMLGVGCCGGREEEEEEEEEPLQQ